MKKGSTKKFWLWSIFIVSFFIGYYLYKIEWSTISSIFFVFGIISLFLSIYNSNHKSHDQKKLMCIKCKVGNSLYNLNNNHHSTIFIFKKPDLKIQSINNLDYFYLICFKCKEITKWALDTNNVSENTEVNFQYFETRKLTKEDLDFAIQEAEQSCSVHSLDKLKNISLQF